MTVSPLTPRDARPCPRCGTKVAAGDKFCSNCGALAPVQPLCPRCGTVVGETAKFCEFCGSRLTRAESPPAALPATEPPARAPPVPISAGKAAPPPVRPEPLVTPPAPAPPDVSEQKITGSGKKTPPSPLPAPGGKKGSAFRYGMIAAVAVVILAIVVLVALLPGISSPAVVPPPLPAPTAPTTSPTPVPTQTREKIDSIAVTPTPSAVMTTPVPGPTDTLPKGTEVYIYAGHKNPDDATVPVRFDGGPGRNVIKRCTAQLTRSDGKVVSEDLDCTKTPSEILLQGTRDTDRLEVFVTQWTGKTYKIIDELVQYR